MKMSREKKESEKINKKMFMIAKHIRDGNKERVVKRESNIEGERKKKN